MTALVKYPIVVFNMKGSQIKQVGENIMNDAEIKQSIIAVREEIANLMREMVWPLRDCVGLSVITNEDEAERRGKAVARFYKELIAADIDKTLALQMAQKLFIDSSEMNNTIREYMAKNEEAAREIVLNIINAQTNKQG